MIGAMDWLAVAGQAALLVALPRRAG